MAFLEQEIHAGRPALQVEPRSGPAVSSTITGGLGRDLMIAVSSIPPSAGIGCVATIRSGGCVPMACSASAADDTGWIASPPKNSASQP